MKKTYFKILSVFITILCMFTLAGCNISIDTSYHTSNSSTSSDQAQIYYLDVGQGDSELICLPTGETILIDAGLKSGGDRLTAYLKELGVDKIDILIATHPHADHIGGNDNATLEILAPNNSEYKDLNNYSIVTKLTYGNNRFLFTGDAEKESENEMLSKGYDLSCDILKLGHHGSSTSTTNKFLTAASPAVAIVSCGKDNDYGHPHKEIMNKLNNNHITVYRTDSDGTILAQTDGNTYSITTDLKSVS